MRHILIALLLTFTLPALAHQDLIGNPDNTLDGIVADNVTRIDVVEAIAPIPGPEGLQGPQGIIGPSGPAGIQGVQGDQGIQGLEGPIGLQGVTGPAGADLLVEVSDHETRITTLEGAGGGTDLSGTIIVMDRYLWAIQKVQAQLRANVRNSNTTPGPSDAAWIAFLTTALGDNPAAPGGGAPFASTADAVTGAIGISVSGDWGSETIAIAITRPVYGPILGLGQQISQTVPLTSYLALP